MATNKMGTISCKCIHILSFRIILQRHFYSTTEVPISSSNPPNSLSPLLNFLVNFLGFSEKQALSTSTKLTELRKLRGSKKVIAPPFLRNADSVIAFLHEKGLSKPQIRHVVSNVPQVLAFRIPQTLKPRVKFLQDLGLSESEAVQFIATQPGILHYSLHGTMNPTVEALRSVLGYDHSNNQSVVRVLKRLRWRAYPMMAKNLISNIALLRAREVRNESIRRLILLHPYTFSINSRKLEELMIKVEEKWGVLPGSGMFLHAVNLLSGYREETINSRVPVFESCGWSRADVVQLFRKNPYCVMVTEKLLKTKLRFFMDELGYDPGYIISRPALMMYSLENRVLPRHEVLKSLKEKGLISENTPLYTALTYSESEFLSKFVVPFENAVPDLYQRYVNSMSCSDKREKSICSKITPKRSKDGLMTGEN